MVQSFRLTSRCQLTDYFYEQAYPRATNMVEGIGDGDDRSIALPTLLNESETAQLLRVKRATVRAERLRGRLGFTRIGARIFYTRQQIAGYLEGRSVPACEDNAKNASDKLANIGSARSHGRIARTRLWCRTWYDKRTRQTRRVSLGTTDFSQASLRLAEWVVANQRTHKATPEEVLETILLTYWNDHAQHLPSSQTQWLGLSYWQEFWTGSTVADITPQEQRRFREWLAKRGTGPSGIDRILSVGRAALNRARKWEEVSDVPHIFGTLTAEAKRAREPKGRPVTPEEIARLCDAARSRHMLLFLLIAATTLARPAAILDLAPSQFDDGHGLLDLNPPGRTQNKKFRPIIPVTPTLRSWLKRDVGPSARYVNYRRKPVKSILHMWRLTRAEAGLDNRVTPYSIRHGVARELRKRRVPTEQISLFLGHLPDGSAATTSIYAPYEPGFLSEAVQAIEEVMTIVRRHLERAQIDRPDFDPGELAVTAGKARRHGIGERKREEVRFLILSGVPHAACSAQAFPGLCRRR
jgi:integrase